MITNLFYVPSLTLEGKDLYSKLFKQSAGLFQRQEVSIPLLKKKNFFEQKNTAKLPINQI
jgi:hypothetical protein